MGMGGRQVRQHAWKEMETMKTNVELVVLRWLNRTVLWKTLNYSNSFIELCRHFASNDGKRQKKRISKTICLKSIDRSLSITGVYFKRP